MNWWRYIFHGHSDYPQVPNTPDGAALLRRYALNWRTHLDNVCRFIRAVIIMYKPLLSVAEIEFLCVSYLHVSFLSHQMYDSFQDNGKGKTIPKSSKHVYYLSCYI